MRRRGKVVLWSGGAGADAGLHTWVFVDRRPVYYSAYARADGHA